MFRLEFGYVQQVEANTARARVRLPAYDDMVTWWLPVLCARAGDDQAVWLPDAGEQVACLLDEHMEGGVIMGGVFSTPTPPPTSDPNVRIMRFKDGTEIRYNRTTHELVIDAKGKLTLHSDTDINVIADGRLQLTGVTGGIDFQ